MIIRDIIFAVPGFWILVYQLVRLVLDTQFRVFGEMLIMLYIIQTIIKLYIAS